MGRLSSAGSSRSPGLGWVSHATAAPVTATGHSTRPATPSTPAPAYTASRRPRGDTAPTRSSVPPASRPTVPAPGTFPSTDTAARNGCGSPCAGDGDGDPDSATCCDDFCSAMARLASGGFRSDRPGSPTPDGHPPRRRPAAHARAARVLSRAIACSRSSRRRDSSSAGA
ncbi:hypothetical protein GT021_14490 [Streptomyces sp. SID5470]|nr:hypothetical protein [Streptomyces sp. SID5470]